jgi:DNA-binding YbaB/EbfC family protein
MFGDLKRLMDIMKNADRIKQNMRMINERMAAARFTGQADGEQVQATANGRGEIVSIKIDPALLQGGDVEMLEGLTCTAVRAAATRGREAARTEMAEATGSLGLPDIDEMLGGNWP